MRAALTTISTTTLMAYASLNRGFKSVALTTQLFPLSVRPETLDAYELGLKSTGVDRRLRLNGSVFYYDYKNVQVTRYVFAI